MQIDDLSEGAECEKLSVVNKWNNDKLAPFKYINKLELSDKLHCSSSNEIRALKLSSNKYQVYFVNPQKGWGLRALNNIKKNCKLFEYAGILEPDGEREDDDYIFSFPFVQQKLMIDAHQKGNLARFMNHSCAANCTTEIIFDGASDPLPHALIIAKRDIGEGEELTMDYGDEWWQIKMAKGMECNCWAPNCRYQKKEENNETCEAIDAEEEATTSSSGSGHGIFSTRQTAKKSIIQTATKSISTRNTGKKSITLTNTVAMMNHI